MSSSGSAAYMWRETGHLRAGVVEIVLQVRVRQFHVVQKQDGDASSTVNSRTNCSAGMDSSRLPPSGQASLMMVLLDGCSQFGSCSSPSQVTTL